MTKPNILFFARGYQADFFPALKNDRFNSVLVTLTPKESNQVRRAGGEVVACFETDYPNIKAAPVPENYLITSYVSERFLGRFSWSKRQEILGKEIKFWSTLLDLYKPSAVVNELVALEISEVLLIECRKRNIPYLAGLNCVVEDLFYWLPDPISISGHKLPTNIVPSDGARDAARAYLKQVRAKSYQPFYVRNLADRLAPAPLMKAVVRLCLWHITKLKDGRTNRLVYEMYTDQYYKRISTYIKSLYRRYDSLSDLPLDAEIIFYPLHQEPESTLNYMSEYFSNQVATLENIMKCLNQNQVLVVKEHPVDKGSLLQRKFWDIRARNSGLYFLPAEVHGREVLSVAERVVTLTSTVGWEAAVMGKTVYVLGEIFYNHLPGVQGITDWKQLKAALQKPADDGRRLSADEVEDFVSQLAMISFPGNPFPHGGLYDRRNLDRVIAGIVAGAGLDRQELTDQYLAT